MRLHRNLVYTVIDSLNDIFNEQEYADKMVQKALKKDARWGARDRKFVAETIYEIVRWKRLYNEIAGTKEHYSRENLWKIFAVWAVLRGIDLPEWPQFNGTPVRRIKGKFDEVQSNRAIAQSIPDWMDELCAKELGEKKWERELKAQNIQASAILRANPLRGSKKQLQDLLAKDDILTKPIKGYPYALELNERKNVFKTAAFKSGLFEMQDASSQLVAEFLDVKPGMRVVDTCAGAGGKTLHIAALMENKGQLIALDIYGNKLKELKRRAKRSGAHNIETREISSTKVIKKLHKSADRVLIDAPCTGLGVLRRNPDAKWKLQPNFLDKITNTQEQILRDYSKMVKEGGKMVYATCSILPQENNEQVTKFLASEEGKDFSLKKEKNIYASVSGYDGFYMALLSRK